MTETTLTAGTIVRLTNGPRKGTFAIITDVDAEGSTYGHPGYDVRFPDGAEAFVLAGELRELTTPASDSMYAELMRQYAADRDERLATTRKARAELTAATTAYETVRGELESESIEVARLRDELAEAQDRITELYAELTAANALAKSQTGRITALSGELMNLRHCMKSVATDLREVHGNAPVSTNTRNAYRHAADMIQRGLAATDTAK